MTDEHTPRPWNQEAISWPQKIKLQQDRLKAAYVIYGNQNADHHIGTALAALKQADDMASRLGIGRLPLHSSLEQYAALAWQMKQEEMKDD